MTLTAHRLRCLLGYCPDTGRFVKKGSLGEVGHLKRDDCGKNYVIIRLDRKKYRAHRLAWLYVHGHWPSGHIDHVDGNGVNNAISNLREATNSQNCMNRGAQSNNQSGYKGVSWYKRDGKWIAKIAVGGKQTNLGYFSTAEEAHAAYAAAAAELHGEFARTK
jgi:hypothetical protein